MNKIIYLPLEPYVERYTFFMSKKDGWTESWFRKYGVNFVRVDGNSQSNEISVGSVLDAYGRSLYSLSQTERVVQMIKNGEVKDGDIIYAEDFWHVGIESLFYIRHLTGIKFKVASFIYAQSVDSSDFTYPMREWIRDIERGFSKGYDYVFTCSQILKDLCDESGFKNVYVSALPFHSELLMKQLSEIGFLEKEKKSQVIFSSRFDDEKNPMFFMDVVEAMPDVNFVLCRPRKKLSNNPEVEKRAWELHSKGLNFKIVDTFNKIDYYNLLSESSVQFNCAEQDWVSFTLLEATLFDCYPVYPRHKDFPLELNNDGNYLYDHLDLDSAVEKIKLAINNKNVSIPQVYKKHDLAIYKQLKTMGYEGI